MHMSPDCWSIVLSYVPNQHRPEESSDLSNCARVNRLFREIVCNLRAVRLTACTPITPDKRILLKASADGKLLAWATKDSIFIEKDGSSPIIENLPHSTSINIDFTPDGSRMALNYYGKVLVKPLAADRGSLIRTGSTATPTAICSDGSCVAIGSTQIYDTKTTQMVCQLDPSASLNDLIAFSPDGTLLVSGSQELKLITIWNIKTKTRLHQLKLEKSPEDLAISPNNELIAVVYSACIIVKGLLSEQTWRFRNADAPCIPFIGFTDNRIFTTISSRGICFFELTGANP